MLCDEVTGRSYGRGECVGEVVRWCWAIRSEGRTVEVEQISYGTKVM